MHLLTSCTTQLPLTPAPPPPFLPRVAWPRRSQLEAASSGWIPEGQWEARLDAALDNPSTL
jgi:hypothetical protein